MPQLGLTNVLTSDIAPVWQNKYSVAFDGTDDNIRITSTAYDVDGSNITFAFWAKRAAIGALHIVMGETANEYDSRIYFSDDNTLRIESDTNADEATITQNTNNTEWHHYVIVCSSGTVTAYQDGSSASVSGDVNGGNITLDTIAGGGSGGTKLEFNGNLDEMAIWNAALDSDAAAKIYNNGVPFDLLYNSGDYDNAGDLVSYWRFGDEDTFPTIKDNFGSNDGTMTNMASGDIVEDTP